MSNLLYSEALDLLCEKMLHDEATLGVAFPYVTQPSGAWDTMLASKSAGYTRDGWSHGNWFCGFWVGLLLAAHLHSKKKIYRDFAEERLRMVAARATDRNTHDIGFIFYSSAKVAFHVTHDPAYRALGLVAADQLRARTICTDLGGYISAWGPLDDPRGRQSAAIDTMANIPLLYWATDQTKDESYRLVAEAHALATQRDFVRPDQSTFHAVEYDQRTGDRKRGFTFQGHADDSCWSRGQAWAIYGFVASYAATGKAAYLDQAEQLAEYWDRRIGDDPVPFWDFDDPVIPNAPRDSAAAAITASALTDLAQLHPDANASRRWHDVARKTLDRLCQDYLARDGKHRGLLLHGCYSKPHHQGVDAAVLFGDFYFVEALCSHVMPGLFRPIPCVRREARS